MYGKDSMIMLNYEWVIYNPYRHVYTKTKTKFNLLKLGFFWSNFTMVKFTTKMKTTEVRVHVVREDIASLCDTVLRSYSIS